MATEKQTNGQSEKLLSEFSPTPYEDWRKEAEAQLKGVPFEKKLMTRTYEDIALQPLYRKEDLEGVPYLDTMPGFAPYLRGSQADVTTSWKIAQEIPYSTAEDFNQAVRYDLERGQNTVTLLFDKATLLGLDPDEAEVGDVGKGGLSVSTVDDLAKALEGIDLENTPLYVQASSAALPTTALLLALARRQGKSAANIQGCIEMDPLGTLAQEGSYPRSVAGGYDLMAQLIKWAKANAPKLQTITVHGQPYSNSGASAVQELAFVLATAVEYLREMQARGLSVDDVAPRTRVSLSSGSNYFMEVAKIRAARLVWAKVIKAFGGNEASQKLTVHVRTASWNKTVYDPYVNMLRTTTEAFAGAVGGCDSMHVGQFDEAIRLPDEFARRIARNTHIILQEESHLMRVIDPAGGSWYVESITNEVARKAWSLFQEVEKKGGMLKALQAGFPQADITKTADRRAENIATRKDVFVGTNKYANLQEKPVPPHAPDYEALHKKRAKYVADYRTSQNSDTSTGILSKLTQVLEAGDDALVDTCIEAVLAGATLGELARTLRHGDDTKDTVEPLRIHRVTEIFEELRQVSEAYKTKTGHRPQVFLANMGPIPQHKPRADFSTDFFQIGGFDVLTNDGFATPEEAAQAALDSGAGVVVICSTDATYPEYVPPITKTIKDSKPETTVIIAGYPKDQIESHKAAGVDEFIHVRANAYEILSSLQAKL